MNDAACDHSQNQPPKSTHLSIGAPPKEAQIYYLLPNVHSAGFPLNIFKGFTLVVEVGCHKLRKMRDD